MSSLFESAFELLFKYKPFVFGQGRLTLDASTPMLLVVVALAAGGLYAMRRYGTVRGRTSPRDRVVLTALRLGIFAVLLLCLLRPALQVATAVPQENFVGVLLDDSRSMQIADVDATERAATLRAVLAPGSPLRDRLEERFKLRFFRFDRTSGRLAGPEAMTFAGSRTDLAGALARTRQELAAVPLSGLVVVSDGADNSSTGMTDAIASLSGAGVPVYTVGVGAEEFSRDLEIVRIDVAREALRGSAVGADVVVRQTGYDGQTVTLLVEDDGRILSSQEVELPRTGESLTVGANFLADDAGARVLSFRIAPLEGEMVQQNNRLEALVNVRDDTPRILYLEGEPRFEVKFVRRAVEDDPNLRLALLERTAENRFYRLFEPDEGFGGDSELFGGFPRTREELFGYSGILLGSVEASFFTADQLRMIADFVSQRGGGLMVLGGRSALTAGGFADTPVAEVLPVVLDPVRSASGRALDFVRAKVSPTLAGRSHPVVQLEADPEANLARWSELPPLGLVNPMARTKPGAITLLEGTGEGLADPVVVLASQRYGAGKVIAFPVVDSWQWQMHYDIALEDMTHETLWRQMLRWLVADVRGQVRARLGADRFAVGEPVEIVAEVADETFLAVNAARVVATVTDPGGAETRVTLPWSVDVDGRYLGSFTPRAEGFHRVVVTAERGDLSLGTDSTIGQATELTAEYFGAEMNRPLLERLARETGGRFYPAAAAGDLAQDMAFTSAGTTLVETLELWDMPAIFLLLVLLTGAEWAWRKLKRLA